MMNDLYFTCLPLPSPLLPVCLLNLSLHHVLCDVFFATVNPPFPLPSSYEKVGDKFALAVVYQQIIYCVNDSLATVTQKTNVKQNKCT